MSQQTIRQQARATARDMAQRRRRERAERDRRLQDLAVQVLTAVGERDAAVLAAERRAGTAVREMTEVEGLTLREAVEWCDGRINMREATRFRRLVREEDAVTSSRSSTVSAVHVAVADGESADATQAAQ